MKLEDGEEKEKEKEKQQDTKEEIKKQEMKIGNRESVYGRGNERISLIRKKGLESKDENINGECIIKERAGEMWM